MSLIQKRYAGLWNNNYRTCSDIFDTLFRYHEEDLKECFNLLKKNEDGYDEIGSSYYGASAAFLNLVCRIFKREEIWGPYHLDLVPLSLKTAQDSASKLTSLSRLMLTYMANTRDDEGKAEPVSMRNIFDEFYPLFSIDEICTCLANMLTRDRTGTWRRPIFYHRHAINAGGIRDSLKRQWDHYQNKDSYDYTEFLVCDCGYAHVNRVVFEFEFFSVRLNGIDQKPLYLMNGPQYANNITSLINKVQRAVGECCQNMIFFKSLYMKEKNIDNNNAYVQRRIHPKTKRQNPQLHTERVIFSHIAYLDHCRRYFICSEENFDKAKTLCEPFLNGINGYLALYDKYIRPINPNRNNVFEALRHKISIVSHAHSRDDLLQCIEM